MMLATDPFFARGGDIGCLLVHGMSGNPSDLRPLADALAARGYTVDAPLLSGHGPTPEGIGRATWHDWRRDVARAHDALAQQCSRVVLIGHSMGGCLGLIESTRRAPAGLVLLAVPTFIGDWRVRLLTLGKYVVRWWYPLAEADFANPTVRARILQSSPDVDLDNPETAQRIRQSVRIPTNTIDHFFRLMRYARRCAPRVTVPTLIGHGRRDTTAVPACAEELYRELASARKELVWFPEAGHQLVTEQAGPFVVEHVLTWLIREYGSA